MAIQIRRGSNAEWEVNNSNIVVGEPAVATDSKRAFIGTASGAYMELANLEAIAPAYDPGNNYMIDDYVSHQGKLYVCTVPTSGAWDASAWQVTSLGQALAENAYSNYETYTMSGDIVSFPNGAGGVPVKDLQVGIEATQDFNGYDAPWAGGTRKNLCPPLTWKGTIDNGTGVYSVGTGTVTASTEEFIPVDFTNNTTYVLSYDASVMPANARNMIFAYNANKEFLGRMGGNAANPRTFDKNSFTSSTTSATGDPAYVRIKMFNDEYTEESIINGKFQVEAGSTATAFAPWENICPISGFSEVGVNVSNNNLLKPNLNSGSSTGVDFVINSDGSVKLNGTASSVGGVSIAPSAFANTLPSGTYYAKLFGDDLTGLTFQVYIDNTSRFNNEKGSFDYSPTKRTGTGNRMRVRWESGTTFDNVTVHPMLVIGSTEPAEYEAYNGNTYTIDLDGTRYGGTLDVTTGALTVTHGYIASYNNETLPSKWISDRDVYASGTIPTIGAEVVYELATPQTVQLTPTQVRTLLGQNNIWADSGEVEVTYRISNVQ